MRTSSLFIFLVLILCSQASAGDLTAGKWTNPIVKVQTDATCCVPDSIELVGSSPSFIAKYSFSTYNEQCRVLFSTSEKNELIVEKKAGKDYYGVSLALLDSIPIEGFRYTSDSRLNVRNTPQPKDNILAGAICDFTMSAFPTNDDVKSKKYLFETFSKILGDGGFHTLLYVFIGLIVFALVALCYIGNFFNFGDIV